MPLYMSLKMGVNTGGAVSPAMCCISFKWLCRSPRE